MKRVFIFVVFGLLASFLLATLTLFNSNQALQWSYEKAQALFLKELAIESIEGTLASPLRLQNIYYETDTQRIEIQKLELEWTPTRLLFGTIQIDEFLIDKVVYTKLAESEETTEPFEVPEEISSPVDLKIADLSLSDFSYYGEKSAQPFVLDTVKLSANFIDQKLRIERLEIHGPKLDLLADTVVHTNHHYQTEGNMKWSLRPESIAPIQARLDWKGDLEQLNVHQTLQAPYLSQTELEIQNIDKAMTVVAKLQLEAIDLPTIRADNPPGIITGNISVDGPIDKLQYNSDLKWKYNEAKELYANLSGVTDGQYLEIENLLVKTKDEQTYLRARGGSRLIDEEIQLKLSASWENLQWPVFETPEFASDRGNIQLNGTLQDYQLDSQFEVSLPEQLRAAIDISGVGDSSSLELQKIDIQTLEGVISGHTLITWEQGIGASLELQATDINPRGLNKEWPGKLSAHIRSEVSKQAETWRVDFDKVEVEGALRDQKFTLSTSGQYEADNIQLASFLLQSGKNRLNASGVLGAENNFQWNIDSPNLGNFHPKANGRLKGQGEVTGSLDKPILLAQLDGARLRYRELKLEALRLDADIDWSDDKPSQFKIVLKNAVLNDVKIETLDINAQGRFSDHAITMELRSSHVNTRSQLIGEFLQKERGPLWKFTLNRSSIEYLEIPAWSLEQPTSGRVTSDSIQVSDSCWRSEPASLCFRVEHNPGLSRLNFELQQLPLHHFKSLLPARLIAEGQLEGKGIVNIAGKSTRPEIDIVLSTSKTHFAIANTDQQETLLFDLLPSQLLIKDQDQKIDMSFETSSEQGDEVRMFAQLAGQTHSFNDRSLSGSVRIDMPAIPPLDEFIPELYGLKGELQADLQLGGKLGAPSIKGNARFRDGQLGLADAGIELKNINVSLDGQDRDGLQIVASAESGPGDIRLQGEIDPSTQLVIESMKISGSNFNVYNGLEADVNISPNIEIEVMNREIQVSGVLGIPYARLTPDQGDRPDVVSVTRDQVIIVEDEIAEEPLPIRGQVKVELGPDVRLQAYGLRANLDGGLIVVEEPDTQTKGTGELRISDGEYLAYGQLLNIQAGKIIFAGGPIDQPGVDLTATRNPRQDIEVGINVRGPLSEPELTTFSNPSMSRSDQLSYLILGKPINETSQGESSALNQAALTTGLSKGNKLFAGIGKKLGLDDAGVQSSEASGVGSSTFGVGKYLTPKLYISYGVGLFQPINILKLRYALSKNWTIVTESSGSASGGDILYEIEGGE